MAAVADHGRDRAFERLYARYVRDVYRYVLAVLRNPAEAEDVTQTTFLNAYRAMQAGAEPQKPHNWLIAIAHNACRSRMRFARRRPAEVPLHTLVEQLEVPEAERPNVGELLHALGRLPFNQRAAITMRELEGRSHTEIAETLGVTVPAAEALIGRARRTLRSQAQAIKGLTVVQLPQSLRTLIRPGDVAGGAAGSAAIAKAVAVIAAGVVAGGVGLAGKDDAPSPDAAPRTLQPRALIAVAAPRAHAHRARAALRTPVTAHRARQPAAPTYPAPAGRPPRSDTSGGPSSPSAHPAHAAGAPAPAHSQSSVPPSSQPVETVQTATTSTSASVAQTVATATTAVTNATEPVQEVVDTVASVVTTVANAVPPPPTVPAVPPPTVPLP